MATNFPSSLDSATQQPSPTATTDMNATGFEHHTVHTNHSGALIALETKLGTGDSNAVADAVLMGTGSGTSGWDTSPTFKGAVTVGVDDTGHDVKFFGATSGKYMEWDESADQLDVSGSLDVTGNTSIQGELNVGVNDTGYDVKFFGATAGKYMEWDQSADQLDVSGSLDVTGNTSIQGELTIGVDDTGYDVKLYGATASKYMLWDQSADALIVKDTVDAVNFKVNGGQGSDGQVLTSTGSGVAWEDAAGGGLPTGLTFSDTAGLTVAPTNVGSNGLWTYASLVLKSQSSLGNTSGTHILFVGANGTTNVGIIGYDGSKSYRVNNMQSGDMYISTAGSRKVYLHSYLTIKETEAYPAGTSGTKDLGTSTALFQDMYSVGGVTTSSDVNVKEEISSENALGLSFINDLRPVQYKLKDGTRKHQGFIAQEVRTALDATDSSASDQGMWGLNTVNSPKTIIDVPNEDAPYADYTEEEIDTIPRQSLRYHEFIAPLVKAVQELTARVVELES